MSLSGCIDKVIGLGAMMGWTSVTYVASTSAETATLAGMAEPMTGLVVAGTALAKHFTDTGRENCANAVLRIKRQVEKDIQDWIIAERLDRGEIEAALAEFDQRLKDIAPSGRELAADNLDAVLVARRLIKRLPSVKDLPDHAPARRVITLIVTTSFEAVLTDDALYRKIEPAVMADVLRRFTVIDKKLDQLNETVRLSFLRAESVAKQHHAELMAAIAREKGVEPKHLAPLFEAVGHEQNLSLDAYESAIRTAVETLLKRARDPIAPSNDTPAVEAAIAAAREQLSRLDSVGAIETLRAARRRQQDAQAELKRGEARLAEEEGDILAAAYRRSEAIVAYQTAIDLDPDRLQAYRNIGTVHATEGRRMDAMAAFERFREAALRLGNERETYVSLIEIGDLRVAEGDRPGALDAYQKGLEIAKTLAARDPANAEWQRDLSVSWNKIGDLRVVEGDRPGALDAYQMGLEIRKILAARDPANAAWQRDLSASWSRIGDLRVAEGDRPGALDAYQKGLEIAKTLAARDPANTERQRDLSASWSRIGDLRVAEGDRPGALDAYQKRLEIMKALAARDPANAEWQRDLSVSWNKIGDLRVAEGDRPGALDAYQKSLEIAEALAARDPDNTGWQRDLSVSWTKIGDLRVAEGDRPGALDAYQKGLEIMKALAARDPANAEWQRDLIVSHWKLAAQGANAVDNYQTALDIALRLRDSGKLAPPDAYFVDRLKELLAAAKAARP